MSLFRFWMEGSPLAPEASYSVSFELRNKTFTGFSSGVERCLILYVAPGSAQEGYPRDVHSNRAEARGRGGWGKSPRHIGRSGRETWSRHIGQSGEGHMVAAHWLKLPTNMTETHWPKQLRIYQLKRSRNVPKAHWLKRSRNMSRHIDRSSWRIWSWHISRGNGWGILAEVTEERGPKG